MSHNDLIFDPASDGSLNFVKWPRWYPTSKKATQQVLRPAPLASGEK